MSTQHHEDMLLQIFDEVCEAFPYLDEEQQIEIANNRFQDMCQWILQIYYVTSMILEKWVNYAVLVSYLENAIQLLEESI